MSPRMGTETWEIEGAAQDPIATRVEPSGTAHLWTWTALTQARAHACLCSVGVGQALVRVRAALAWWQPRSPPTPPEASCPSLRCTGR